MYRQFFNIDSLFKLSKKLRACKEKCIRSRASRAVQRNAAGLGYELVTGNEIISLYQAVLKLHFLQLNKSVNCSFAP